MNVSKRFPIFPCIESVAIKGILLAPLFLVVACASYQTKQQPARDDIRARRYASALQKLEGPAQKESDDQLAYLLDYATALQLAGRYSDSNTAFQKADTLSEIQDYHSLTRVTGSLLLAEELVQYKGEDFEKVMINAMAAINYLELGSLDDALVEVRRLNNKLYKYKYEAKRNYEQNAFAFYVSGAIWEADQKWDDAYIAYKNAYEVNPNFPLLKADLLRTAKLAQRPEDLKSWREKFTDQEVPTINKNHGELIVVFQQGWGPRKRPRPEFPRLPQLIPVTSNTVQAEVRISPVGSENVPETLRTERIYSVEDVAIKSLDDQYAELVAKRIGGVVAKEVVADQIRQKNEMLGMIVQVAMHASDRADLRQWSTLPESFQIARMPLSPGKYKVQLVGIASGGGYSSEDSEPREIEIRSRKKTFVSWRSTN